MVEITDEMVRTFLDATTLETSTGDALADGLAAVAPLIMAAHEAGKWIKTTDALPTKPDEGDDAYAWCVVIVDGELKMLPFNIHHECWDAGIAP